MGNQCTCAANKISSEHEINGQKDLQPITSTTMVKTTSAPQPQIKRTLQDTMLETFPITITQKNAETYQILEKEGSEEIINLEHKKQKKRVQVLMPGKIIENNDQVTFVQREISKEDLGFIVKTLKQHFIFSQLSPEEILYVVTNMRYCVIQGGKYVFKQRDISSSYYIILQGRCRVEINGETKKHLIPGNSFGDLGIIYNAPRSASILAQSNCLFAELNPKTLRKVINDINFNYEQQNRTILEKMDFFKQLTEVQKNVLASNCITQVYKAGQIIFNKGDDANALYIIREGIVSILEKKIDLKAGDNVGINAIMSSGCTTRSNSLIAKTQCKLLSLTRDTIIKNLGDSVQNILQKNLAMKILKQSDIWEMYTDDQWMGAIQSSTLSKFNKEQIVFKKGSRIPPLTLYIILSSDAKSIHNPKTDSYLANSIVESIKTFKKEEIIFEDDYVCTSQALLLKVKLPKQRVSADNSRDGPLFPLSNNNAIRKNKKENSQLSINAKEHLSLKDFIVLRKLRSGNFGRVYACYNNKTGKKYALKVMNKESLISSNVMSYVLKEQELLRTLPKHPFLVKYHAIFKQSAFITLVLDLLEGEDLFDAINSKLPLSEPDVKFFMTQLILVVEHLHAHKVVYRDLKPQNVILNLDGYLTLVDMGTAKKLTIQNRFKTMTIIGTPHYMAPQIVLGKGYGFSADWWSLGVMMYEMTCGKLPYGEHIEDPFSVYQEILKKELKFPNGLSNPIKQVINMLLNKSVQKRVKNGSRELKQSAFFNNYDWDMLLRKQFQAKVFPSRTSRITQEQVNQALIKNHSPALQIFLKDKEREG